MLHARRAAAAALALAVLSAGCNVRQKRALVAEAVDAPGERREMFEATLRVLDANPTYVDEFFVLALEHPKTLERFIQRTVGRLDEPWLAELTARELAASPPALYQILVETLEAAEDPEARDAIARAIADRADLSARAIVERPDSVAKITEATVDAVVPRPAARAAFVAAMRARAAKIAPLLAAEPATLRVLVEEILRIAAKDPAVARVVVGATVPALDAPALARETAGALVRHPATLEPLIARTLGAAAPDAEARAAIARAIEANAPAAADVIASRPQALGAVLRATLERIDRHPGAREALLDAVRDRRDVLVSLLLQDPGTAAALAGELVERGIGSASLADRFRDLLRRGGAGDEDGGAASR